MLHLGWVEGGMDKHTRAHTFLRKWKMVSAVLLLLESENRCSVCALALCQSCVNILTLFVHCRGVQIPANASKCSSVAHWSEMQHWTIEKIRRRVRHLTKITGTKHCSDRSSFYLIFRNHRVGGCRVPCQIFPRLVTPRINRSQAEQSRAEQVAHPEWKRGTKGHRHCTLSPAQWRVMWGNA